VARIVFTPMSAEAWALNTKAKTINGAVLFGEGIELPVASYLTWTGQARIYGADGSLELNYNIGNPSELRWYGGTTTLQMSVDTDGNMTWRGDLNHDGSNVGFYGIAPVARSAGWTITNDAADRAFDADTVAVAELADVVATLITDLAATGIIGASA